jgi:dihydrolipoamide dehydrogenase
MSKSIPVELPDIGSFENVDVIDVLVAPGDVVRKEQSIITLESDKATMDIPAPAAGTVSAVHVKVGDRLSKGALILTLDAEESAAPAAAMTAPPEPQESAAGPIARTVQTEVAVLGAGVGGYTAAFRAADLGKKVVLIERHPVLGGVCLNVGCIPSKALLHAAEVISEVAEIAHMGVRFGPPQIDLDAMRTGKERVVGRLSAGVSQLAKQRKVTVLQGQGRFDAPNRLVVQTAEGAVAVEFEHCVVACGSRPVEIAGFPYDDPRLMDSTGALALADIPARLLVIGGGIIGMEMATVYGALGSRVDVVELQEGLIPGCDRDLVKPLQKRMEKRLNRILLGTRVKEVKPRAEGLEVQLEGKGAPITETYDRVLVAVGRAPNGRRINAEAAGVKVDERGFIPVDAHMRTNVPHIFAIGDVVGNPMLAHKAAHEGKVAAEVIAGLPALFDPMAIPSVAYTDPEIAWMGLTETEAKAKGIAYEKGALPWSVSGRALGIGRDEGLTKLLFDPETKRVLGAGIVGPNAGELIGEAVLALEMGADAEDIGLTIHPHPTLSETIGLAAEMAEGTITDILPRKKK